MSESIEIKENNDIKLFTSFIIFMNVSFFLN